MQISRCDSFHCLVRRASVGGPHGRPRLRLGVLVRLPVARRVVLAAGERRAAAVGQHEVPHLPDDRGRVVRLLRGQRERRYSRYSRRTARSGCGECLMTGSCRHSTRPALVIATHYRPAMWRTRAFVTLGHIERARLRNKTRARLNKQSPWTTSYSHVRHVKLLRQQQ